MASDRISAARLPYFLSITARFDFLSLVVQSPSPCHRQADLHPSTNKVNSQRHQGQSLLGGGFGEFLQLLNPGYTR